MTLQGHHLQDERLFDCYLGDRHGDAPDPPLAEHLADCAACASRYAEIARFMDAMREEAQDETDAIFTPERLRMQQEAIARRIDHLGRHARVISFPSQLVNRTMAVSTSHSAPRWIAAAAAAGIFVGVALGASYEWELHAHPARRVVAETQLAPRQPLLSPLTALDSVDSGPISDVVADDAFLSELDAALDRPRTRELQPIDALTPHVREIRVSR